ncbi:MAG: hypothetical protein ACI8Y4_004053 [Candidatus Poriferisodalaceae bacterium]|jgi:hypothetical protein
MVELRNEMRWNDKISRAELTTDEPIGNGSHSSNSGQRGEHDSTITGPKRGMVGTATL